MKVSVIIPCYNESKVIENTYKKLIKVLKDCDFIYELVFVDDGSRDNTGELLKKFALSDDNVKYILFSRNFGKEAGMLAGLTYASGDAVVLIDADLQHPPELIPKFINAYNEGYDQVVAKRNRKGDSKYKSVLSKIYYKLVNKFIDVKLIDGVGDYRLLSRKAVDTILSMPEHNRFSKGIFSWIGFKEKQITYENVTRDDGESKWSFKSLLEYGIDGILSFNNKPLRLLIALGGIVLAVGIVYILFILIQAIINGVTTPGYFTTIAAVLLLGGIQLISLGIIGEYIGRIYYEVKKRPHFVVDETNINKKGN